MGNAMDFEKLRKRRRRTLLVKRLLALGLVVFVVLGAVVLNNVLIEAGANVQINDWVEGLGGSGYPIQHPGGRIRTARGMGDHLVVLGDTNLFVYNKKGKQVVSQQQMSDKTVLLTNQNRLLTYQIGAEGFQVHSRSQELLRREMPHSILCADMNEQGDIALATSSVQYVAEVTVYPASLESEHIFKWYSADNQVVDVSLSPDGLHMAVACANTEGGVLQTVIYLFDFSLDSEAARVQVAGELPLKVEYREPGRIGVLTDQRYFTLDASGATTGSYSFGDRQLVQFLSHGRQALVITQAWEDRSQSLVLLDDALKPAATRALEGRVRDLALDDKRVYLLTDAGITECDQTLQTVGRHQERGITAMAKAGGSLYYVGEREIGIYHSDRDNPDNADRAVTSRGESAAAPAPEQPNGPDPSQPEDSADGEEPDDADPPQPEGDGEATP